MTLKYMINHLNKGIRKIPQIENASYFEAMTHWVTTGDLEKFKHIDFCPTDSDLPEKIFRATNDFMQGAFVDSWLKKNLTQNQAGIVLNVSNVESEPLTVDEYGRFYASGKLLSRSSSLGVMASLHKFQYPQITEALKNEYLDHLFGNRDLFTKAIDRYNEIKQPKSNEEKMIYDFFPDFAMIICGTFSILSEKMDAHLMSMLWPNGIPEKAKIRLISSGSGASVKVYNEMEITDGLTLVLSQTEAPTKIAMSLYPYFFQDAPGDDLVKRVKDLCNELGGSKSTWKKICERIGDREPGVFFNIVTKSDLYDYFSNSSAPYLQTPTSNGLEIFKSIKNKFGTEDWPRWPIGEMCQGALSKLRLTLIGIDSIHPDSKSEFFGALGSNILTEISMGPFICRLLAPDPAIYSEMSALCDSDSYLKPLLAERAEKAKMAREEWSRLYNDSPFLSFDPSIMDMAENTFPKGSILTTASKEVRAWREKNGAFIKLCKSVNPSNSIEIRDWLNRALVKEDFWQKMPSSPTLKWLNDQTKAWHEEQMISEASKNKWDKVLKDPIVSDVFEIVEIDNGGDLWREGKSMSHCVNSYDARCLANECRIFSVRKNTASRPLATIEITLKPEVSIRQVKGFANSKVSDEMLEIANQILKEVKGALAPETSLKTKGLR